MERKRLYHLNRESSNTSDNFDFFSQSDERKPVRKLVTPSSSLEIVEGDLFEGASGLVYERSSSEASSRPWSRSSVGSVPPRNDSSLSRRTLTPTKQVSLQAVRRREERSDPFVDHIAVGNLQREGSDRSLWDNSVHDDDIDFSRLSMGDYSFRQNQKNKSFVNGKSSSSTGNMTKDNQASSQGKEGTNVKNNENKNEDSSSDDDDDNNDEDKDTNEKLKAPTELLMEVSWQRRRPWTLSKKNKDGSYKELMKHKALLEEKERSICG